MLMTSPLICFETRRDETHAQLVWLPSDDRPAPAPTPTPLFHLWLWALLPLVTPLNSLIPLNIQAYHSPPPPPQPALPGTCSSQSVCFTSCQPRCCCGFSKTNSIPTQYTLFPTAPPPTAPPLHQHHPLLAPSSPVSLRREAAALVLQRVGMGGVEVWISHYPPPLLSMNADNQLAD